MYTVFLGDCYSMLHFERGSAGYHGDRLARLDMVKTNMVSVERHRMRDPWECLESGRHTSVQPKFCDFLCADILLLPQQIVVSNYYEA